MSNHKTTYYNYLMFLLGYPKHDLKEIIEKLYNERHSIDYAVDYLLKILER